MPGTPSTTIADNLHVLYSADDRLVLDFLRAHPERIRSVTEPEDGERIAALDALRFILREGDDPARCALAALKERDDLYRMLLEEATLHAADEDDRTILQWLRHLVAREHLCAHAQSERIVMRYGQVEFTLDGPIRDEDEFARKTLGASRVDPRLRAALIKAASAA